MPIPRSLLASKEKFALFLPYHLRDCWGSDIHEWHKTHQGEGRILGMAEETGAASEIKKSLVSETLTLLGLVLLIGFELVIGFD